MVVAASRNASRAAPSSRLARAERGVFFSDPLDLDLMMMTAYPNAYRLEQCDPDEKTIVAVLGKST